MRCLFHSSVHIAVIHCSKDLILLRDTQMFTSSNFRGAIPYSYVFWRLFCMHVFRCFSTLRRLLSRCCDLGVLADLCSQHLLIDPPWHICKWRLCHVRILSGLEFCCPQERGGGHTSKWQMELNIIQCVWLGLLAAIYHWSWIFCLRNRIECN